MQKADSGPKGRNLFEEKEEVAGDAERRTRGQDGLMPQAARVTALLLPRSLDLVVEITLGRNLKSGRRIREQRRWALCVVMSLALAAAGILAEASIRAAAAATFGGRPADELVVRLVHYWQMRAVGSVACRHPIRRPSSHYLSPPSRRPSTASPTIRFVVDHWSSSLPIRLDLRSGVWSAAHRLHSFILDARCGGCGLSGPSLWRTANAVGKEEPSNCERDIDKQVSELLYLLRRTEALTNQNNIGLGSGSTRQITTNSYLNPTYLALLFLWRLSSEACHPRSDPKVTQENQVAAHLTDDLDSDGDELSRGVAPRSTRQPLHWARSVQKKQTLLYGPAENTRAKVLEKLQVLISPAIFARIALSNALYLKSKNVVKAEVNTRITSNKVAFVSTSKWSTNSVLSSVSNPVSTALKGLRC
ncbi:hypothetical protein BJ912DRAFT_925786 [Pholiota molesta]|nr:hypothetical protein BJ912DRAFT_925786 [Pholiota molesta]